MPDHDRRHISPCPCQEHGGARDPRNVTLFKCLHKFADRHDCGMKAFGDGGCTDVPYDHDEINAGRKREWYVAPLNELCEIGWVKGCGCDEINTCHRGV